MRLIKITAADVAAAAAFKVLFKHKPSKGLSSASDKLIYICVRPRRLLRKVQRERGFYRESLYFLILTTIRSRAKRLRLHRYLVTGDLC